MYRPRSTQYEIIIKIAGVGGFVASKKYLVSSNLFGEKGVSPFAPVCFGTDLAQIWHKKKQGSDSDNHSPSE
jgi:hypothetical protein